MQWWVGDLAPIVSGPIQLSLTRHVEGLRLLAYGAWRPLGSFGFSSRRDDRLRAPLVVARPVRYEEADNRPCRRT